MKITALLSVLFATSQLAVAYNDDNDHRRMQNDTAVEEEEDDETTWYQGCDQVAPGDLFFAMVDASDDDAAVVIMTLVDLPGDLHLFVTDFPWTGDEFTNSTGNVPDLSGESGEGTVMFKVPSDGLPAGSLFNYSESTADDWESIEGDFDLAITGDSVFVYCMTDNETQVPLVGLSTDVTWAESGKDIEEYGTDASAQPDVLIEFGSIVLEHYSKYEYTGEPAVDGYTVEQKDAMKASYMQPSNWAGDGYTFSGATSMGMMWTMSATLLLVLWGTAASQ